MKDNNKVVSKTLTRYASDWRIVEAVANTPDYLLEGKMSRALRFIVQDWANNCRERHGLRMTQEELQQDI